MKRLFLVTMIFAFLNVSAQDTLMVARADLLKMTAEKNFQVMIAQQDHASAKADYTQSMAVFSVCCCQGAARKRAESGISVCGRPSIETSLRGAHRGRRTVILSLTPGLWR